MSRNSCRICYENAARTPRCLATGSDVMWSIYKPQPASPLRPPLSCRARHAAVCLQSLHVDGVRDWGGSCPGGLVDQCVMITAGQLAVFPFASLILAGEQLFFFFQIFFQSTIIMQLHYCARNASERNGSGLLWDVALKLYIQWSHQALLWAAMSLTKKLAPWTSFLFLLPDTNTPLFVTRICCGACKLPHSWCVYCPSLCTPAYLCWVYSAFPVAEHKQPLKCCNVHKSLWSKHTQKRMHGKWDKH